MANILILGKKKCPFILQRGINAGKSCGLINKKCQNNSHIKYRMIKQDKIFRTNHPELPLIVDGKVALLKSQNNFLQLIYI